MIALPELSQELHYQMAFLLSPSSGIFRNLICIDALLTLKEKYLQLYECNPWHLIALKISK